MLCGFLVFATCKAMAYDECTAALLVRQNIPVWSGFCLFRLDSFDSKKGPVFAHHTWMSIC